MKRNLFIRVLLLLACMASVALTHTSAYGAEPVRIGVLAARPKAQDLAKWQPLAVALKRAMPKLDFVVEVFTDTELDAAVASRQLDFVLTNPGHYVRLSRLNGLSAPLATLIDDENGQATAVFGGVIFSRAGQANINTLQDIRGKTIATIGTGYLAGYQMQAYELKQAGVRLPQDAKLVFPGKSMDNVVEAVLDGRADVGFVRSGLLEHMVQDNRLDMKQVKVLNSQNLAGFPVEVSTRLYPEWLFAALPHADENIARHIVATLLLLEENTAATHAIGLHGFAVPADYTPVVDLLREMRFPPFEATPQFTLRDIWARYFWQSIGTLLVFGLILLLSLRLLVTGRKLESQHQALLLRKQQLQKSESHWRTLVHTLPDLIWLKDREGVYLDCNPRFECLFGADEKDIVGKTDYDYVDKELADFFRKHDQAAMDKGAPSVNEEWVTFASDGHRELLETTKVPMLDAEGYLIGVLGIGHDITERNQAEEALHQSETRLRTLYESTSDAVMLLDEKGFFDCNKATLAMFGCATKEEFYSKHPADLSPPEQPCGTDSVTLANQQIATAMEHGHHQFEWMHRRADTGEIFPADVLLNSMELDGRTVLQATVRDITESKKRAFQLGKLSFALNHLNDAVYLMNENGRFNYVNDEVCRVLGYTREELIGKMGVSDIGQGWTDEMWAEHWQDVKLNGFRLLEAAHRTKDGRTFPIEVSANFFEYDGQSYIMSMVREITERKQAEDTLRKLSLAVEQSLNSIVITDLDANIEYVNQAFVKESGYSFDEAVGRNPRLLSSGKNPKKIYDEMWASLTRGETWKGEFINRRKDGSEYIESVSTSPVHQANGQVTHYLAIKENITERKEKEEQIIRLSRTHQLLSLVSEAIVRTQNKNELFEAICNSSVESKLFRFAWIGMLDENRSCVISVASAGVEKGYKGYMAKVNIRLDNERTSNGPIGRSIRTGIHVIVQDIENDPSMAPWRDDALKRGFRASAAFPINEAGAATGTINVYAGEAHFFTPDITRLMLNLTADVSFALGVFTEKMRRKQMEGVIIQLNTELEHRVQERTRQLEAANKELEAFSYSVSHDLRAPLRSIDGFSRTLSKKYHAQLDATGRDWLDRICRASQRMGHLIDDMLKLSQVVRSPLMREQADLSGIAENVADDLSKTNPERQVQFVLQQGLTVQADPGLLRIVMDNLLGNAYKFTGKKADPKIEFGVCDIKGEHTFFVRDNGDGFNMEYAHKLFGTFQRLHTVNEFEGTGIGLATVQRIIRRHNGEVWAEAIEGQGATLYFTLPQRERGGGATAEQEAVE